MLLILGWFSEQMKGGTTGAPKIVPLSNRNVVSSAIGLMLAIGTQPGDRFFIALPLFHVGGAFCTSLAGLGAGATLVIPTAGGFRNPDVVSNFWRIVDAQRITHRALDYQNLKLMPPRRMFSLSETLVAPGAPQFAGLQA
jgi:acyl-CoA synthetase (AMP-forming)/AMP-acid ligase II